MKKTLIIHPFLCAIFPSLFLYTNNLGHVYFHQILLPIFVIVVFTCLLIFILRMIINDDIKTGIILSYALILFFSYGHLYDIIQAWQIINLGTNDLHIHRYLLLTCAITFSILVYYFVTQDKDLYNFNRAMNVGALALLITPIINIGSYQLDNIESSNLKSSQENHLTTNTFSLDELPDIYYIVTDAHTSSKVLKNVFNYDNTQFVNGMIEKGFFVASNSYSNYAHTSFSLNSSLNMEYFKGKQPAKNLDIQNNNVLRFVKSLGYKYIHFDSGWGDTVRNLFADMNIRCGYLNEFIMIFIPTTMLTIIDEKLNFLKLKQRDKVLCTFSKLSNIYKIKGPKFIFAHIESPHPPYVFSANGEPVVNKPLTMVGFQPKDGYLNQLKYIEKRLTQLVDDIINNSENKPIIIINGDHGPATTFANVDDPFESIPTDENIRERMGILNMYYVTSDCSDLLYDNISPVNSFRLIFNCYFDGNYTLLSDLSFYNKGSDPFVNVTDLVSIDTEKR